MSLKLKDVAICGGPKLLANAMRSYPGQKVLTLRIMPWRGLSCLDPPNKKFDLPSSSDCDSH